MRPQATRLTVRPSSRMSSAVTSEPPLWKSVRLVSAGRMRRPRESCETGTPRWRPSPQKTSRRSASESRCTGMPRIDDVAVVGVEILDEAGKPGPQGRAGGSPHAPRRAAAARHDARHPGQRGPRRRPRPSGPRRGPRSRRQSSAPGSPGRQETRGSRWWEVGAGIATSLWVAGVLSSKVGWRDGPGFTEVDNPLVPSGQGWTWPRHAPWSGPRPSTTTSDWRSRWGSTGRASCAGWGSTRATSTSRTSGSRPPRWPVSSTSPRRPRAGRTSRSGWRSGAGCPRSVPSASCCARNRTSAACCTCCRGTSTATTRPCACGWRRRPRSPPSDCGSSSGSPFLRTRPSRSGPPCCTASSVSTSAPVGVPWRSASPTVRRRT